MVASRLALLGAMTLTACGSESSIEGVAAAKTRAGRDPASPVKVVALGRLAPSGKVIEVGAPAGDRVAVLLVREGDTVAASAPLAQLESHDERQSERDQIASKLDEARSRLQAETVYGSAVVQEAELELRRLQELHPLDVDQAEAEVEALRAALTNERRTLERFARLRETGGISLQEYDQQATLVRRHEEELRSAQAQHDRLVDGHDLEVGLARARLDKARADLTRSQLGAEVDSLGKNLALAETRLARAVIRAPASGKVLEIHIRPGETTGSGPILSLGDTTRMMVIAEVYETDVRWVEQGQHAEVTSPALAGPLQGTVSYVGSTVSRNEVLEIDPAADHDRRVVEVWIDLEAAAAAALLVNLQVDVEIDIAGS